MMDGTCDILLDICSLASCDDTDVIEQEMDAKERYMRHLARASLARSLCQQAIQGVGEGCFVFVAKRG